MKPHTFNTGEVAELIPILDDITKGNKDAFSFALKVYDFAEVVDDLIDRDRPVEKEAVIRSAAFFILELAYNQFYLNNKDSLTTMVISMMNRYLDAEAWRTGDCEIKKATSHMLMSGDMDFYLHIAFLCGGWDHQRAMSAKYRNLIRK